MATKPEKKYENMLYIIIVLAWLIALSLAVYLASTTIKRRLSGLEKSGCALVMAVTANRFQTSKAGCMKAQRG
jgi:sensor histidine kinase regulating citrate/malate metabolism